MGGHDALWAFAGGVGDTVKENYKYLIGIFLFILPACALFGCTSKIPVISELPVTPTEIPEILPPTYTSTAPNPSYTPTLIPSPTNTPTPIPSPTETLLPFPTLIPSTPQAGPESYRLKTWTAQNGWGAIQLVEAYQDNNLFSGNSPSYYFLDRFWLSDVI